MLWIVGHKGLLGSALSLKCKAALHMKFVGSGKEINIGNLEELQAFAQKHEGITHIVNCAAFSEVDAAEIRQKEAYLANAVGPENLAIVANEIGAKLIHISTDYVFSGKLKRPLLETDPVGPCSYYGKTKLEGEQRALARSACVIRTSWIFGSRGKNFVSKLLTMLQTKKEIRLTDDQWGRFTYAPDLADAILRMLYRNNPKNREFGKEAPQNFQALAVRSERPLPNGKARGQMKIFEAKLTPLKTDSSGCFGIGCEGLYQYANIGVATKYEFGLAMKEEAFLLGYPIMADAVIPVPGVTFPAPCERPIYSAFDTSKIEKIVKIRHWREALKDFLCVNQPACL